ncbi:MAG: peptidoglycan DD-metalloendopeptidase family protein [Rikenellaceae bacterium]|nr:peptidoglycan DD-metalloendopeptidase family protein [Rikenellaceae bacterium]
MRVSLRILTLLVALLIALPSTLRAQTAEEKARIAEQRRIVEQLEKEVEASEKALSAIKKDKSTAQQRVKNITRQINSRNQLLTRTEREIGSIERNITLNDSLIRKTDAEIAAERDRYAEMVRDAHRNYKQNNYITYLLASKSFTDVARRIANIRAMAVLRSERLHRIDSLAAALSEQQEQLSQRRHSLDSVRGKAQAQRKKLQGDVRSAEQAMKQLTSREQKALREQMESEERLDAAIDALRRLTKGNTEGASFSRSTSNLNLPVVGGRVKEYKGNMAVVTGVKGAAVRSIYDGKVVEVRRNRISGKYDVFVAHGEYITSYAGLDNVTVAKDAKVAKNGTIGVIGASVNLTSMQTEYRIVFGIYSPNPKETMRAADCFKK